LELSHGYNTQHAVTVFFATLILARLFNGINCRSMEDSIFKLKLFTNKPLVYTTLLVILLTASVIYIPVLQKPFRTIFLSVREVAVALFASSTVLFMAEIQKYVRRRMATQRSITF